MRVEAQARAAHRLVGTALRALDGNAQTCGEEGGWGA